MPPLDSFAEGSSAAGGRLRMGAWRAHIRLTPGPLGLRPSLPVGSPIRREGSVCLPAPFSGPTGALYELFRAPPAATHLRLSYASLVGVAAPLPSRKRATFPARGKACGSSTSGKGAPPRRGSEAAAALPNRSSRAGGPMEKHPEAVLRAGTPLITNQSEPP